MMAPDGAEAIMSELVVLPHQRTDIYRVAMQLCVAVREAKISHAELRDQAERASVSTFLAISEGLPHAGPKMRRQYFERARASAWEVASAVHLANAIGVLSEARWRDCHTLAARTSAMLVALVRRG
jgi:four helix bundle protein